MKKVLYVFLISCLVVFLCIILDIKTDKQEIKVIKTITKSPYSRNIGAAAILEKEYDFNFIIIETTIIEEKQINSPYIDIIDSLTEEEKELLYKITYAEAGNQSIEGQRAVIEVILNRVLSNSFPNSLVEVLSQKNQFSTWKVRNIVTYNDTQIQALELVYIEEPILSQDYFFFATKKFAWANNHIKIGDHWFSTK